MGDNDMAGDPVQPGGAHGPDKALPTGPAGSQGSRPRGALIAAVIAGVCMLTAGIAIAVFSAPGGSADRTLAGAPPVGGATFTQQPTASAPSGHATASRQASTTPSVTGHGIAKNALRFPKRLTNQVRRWKSGLGGKAMTAVTAQMGYALQAYGAKLYAPMKLACVRLGADIQTARAGPPIPYAAMQRMYGKALARLSQAAANCRHAISIRSGEEAVEAHLHSALLQRSLAGLAAGSKVLYTATAEIRAL